MLLNRRQNSKAFRAHLSSRRDNEPHFSRFEPLTTISGSELLKLWIGGKNFSHSLFELANLRQLPVLGFVFVEVRVKRLGLMDVFGFLRQSIDCGFESDSSICILLGN